MKCIEILQKNLERIAKTRALYISFFSQSKVSGLFSIVDNVDNFEFSTLSFFI